MCVDSSSTTALSRVLQWLKGFNGSRGASKENEITLPEPIIKSIDDEPHGYPKIARLIDADPNFFLMRRFGFLRARTLLYQQDVLASLERELERLDNRDKEEDPVQLRNLNSRKRDDNQKGSRRRELFTRVDEKLKQYGEYYSSLGMFSKANTSSRRSAFAHLNLADHETAHVAKPEERLVCHQRYE